MAGVRRGITFWLVLLCVLALSVPVGLTAASGQAAGTVDPHGASGVLEGAAHNAYTPQQFGGASKQLWSRSLPGPVSYAVIDNGRAFATVHGWLFALGLATGATLWGVDLGAGTAANTDTASVAATAGVVIVSNREDGAVVAYDEASGTQLWQIPGVSAGRDYSAVVAPGNGLFYVDEQQSDAVEAHRVTDGTLVWSAQSSNGGLVATSSAVYASTSDCGGDIAFNAATGAQLWSTQGTCGSGGLAYAQSVVARGSLYDWHRVVLKATTGAQTGTYIGDVPPIRVGADLITQQSGVLRAVNATTSRTVWTFTGDPGTSSATADVVGRALVVGSTVFAVTTSNRLYQLSLSHGRATAPAIVLPGAYAGTNPSPLAAMSFGDSELLVPAGNYLTAFVHGSYTGPAAGAASPITVTLPASSPGSPAADYGQDASHDNTNGSGALSEPLTAAWTRTLPGTMSYPLIAGGLVYLTDLTSTANYLYGLSGTSGAVKWQVALPMPTNGDGPDLPVYDNGELFVVTDTGELYEVDAATGHVRYVHLLDAGQIPVSAFTAPPVANQGTLYLSGNSDNVGVSVAVRESDATVLWGDELPGAIGSPAVTSDSLYYAGCAAERLARTTGKAVWVSGTGCAAEDGIAPTAVHDGFVWDLNDTPLAYTLNESTGTAPSTFTSGVEPSLSGSVAFVTSDATLYAEDITTHRLLWQQSQDFVDVPVAVGNTVYDVTATGQVIGMDASTGAITYQSAAYYPTSHDLNGLPSAPAIADGLLVVPEGQHLVALHGS